MPTPLSRQLLHRASGHAVELICYGEVAYEESQRAMRLFTDARNEHTVDQIWLLQHPPVYTQGTACSQQPLAPTKIPLIHSDRGGQITYHGPGQIVMYPMLDLKRLKIGVKHLVTSLEQAVIDLLAENNIEGLRRQDAPGVYVRGEKIAALGLRVRRGCSYHGLSLNVDMDLTPFANIDPCGFAGLKTTQIKNLGIARRQNLESLGTDLVNRFCACL